MTTQLTGKTPIYAGSTGGLLIKADIEEKYAITWSSSKQQVFELPTGGVAVMNEGDNLLYLPRKEHCIALGKQFLSKFKPKIDYKIYRIYPNGEVEYLHPKDGSYPEKINPGRPYVGKIDRCIGANPEPSSVKFSGKQPYDV